MKQLLLRLRLMLMMGWKRRVKITRQIMVKGKIKF